MNLKSLRDLNTDDVLSSVGLQTKSSPVPGMVGCLVWGMLVGAGIALLLAPKPGSELRDDLRARLRRVPREGGRDRRAPRGRRQRGRRLRVLEESGAPTASRS